MTKLVPYLSTPAGACLTHDNWYELGITTVAYDFAELVMKPGLTHLWGLGAIRDFLGWTKSVILDARTLTPNAQGQFRVKSHYDGATHYFTEADFWALTDTLQPTAVVVAKNMVFLESYLKQTNSNVIWDCQSEGYDLSDKPADDAFQGRVYRMDTFTIRTVSILDTIFADHFEPIDNACTCPTCQQGFTCAYLHHLYQNTPLLCQRYLIMHNIHATQQFAYHLSYNSREEV